MSYLFDLRVIRGQVPEFRGPKFWDLDGTWHMNADEEMHSLRRPDGGDVTAKAWQRVEGELFPALAEWLESPTAQDLLEDGHAHQRSEHQRLISDAAGALWRATDRVEAIQDALDAGLPIATSDEKFLERINSQLVTTTGTLSAATSPAATRAEQTRLRLNAVAQRQVPEPPSL